jgi:hypothetical protein
MKSFFLHDDLSEEMFMEQPPSFVIDSNLVCRLEKYLYGLKQGSRDWYVKIDCFFIHIGLKHWKCDQILYVIHTHGNNLIIYIYVV